MDQPGVKGSKAHLVPPELRSSEITSAAEGEFYLHSRPPLSSTLEEYEQEILKYIDWRFGLEMRGIGLVELNRRFYHTGSAFNLVASKLAMRLVVRGELKSFRYGTTLVLLPSRFDASSSEEGAIDGLQKLLRLSLDNGRTVPRRRK